MEARLTRRARIGQEAGETVPRRSHYLISTSLATVLSRCQRAISAGSAPMAPELRNPAHSCYMGIGPVWGGFRRGRIAIEADLPFQPACRAAANPPPPPTTIPPASR